MNRNLLALACVLGLAAAAASPSAAQEKKMTRPGTYAHFATTMGDFTVKLMPESAPRTVANFVGLAEGTIDPATGKPGKSKPFYDGLTFHRIIAGFMIQGGDPQGTGFGGPGYKIPDEFDKSTFEKAGILAMANTGQPNSGGSQFFISVAPYPAGNHKYAAFGEVVDGYNVVQKISQVKTGAGDKPVQPVIMKKVTIEKVQ